MAQGPKSPKLSRRDFTKVVTTFLGSVMGVLVGVPVIGYVISPAVKKQGQDEWVSLGALENYPVGAPTLFTFTRAKVNGWERTTNSYGVFVVKESDDKIKVFSNVCTHLSCRVNWKEESQTFDCPCHDAKFNIQGQVAYGPPPRPMDEYEWKLEEGNILIHLMEG